MIVLMIRQSATWDESEFILNAKPDKIKSINAESAFRFSDVKETDKTDLF